MSDKPEYKNSEAEPSSIGSMFGLMTQKPAPPLALPVTVMRQKIGRIWVDMKSRILLGDKSTETVIRELEAAREATRTEVFAGEIRDDAIKRYDEMIRVIGEGGQIVL